jgi:putative SOS response-associated peptidase YedK
MCGRYITAQAAAFEKAIRLGKISWQFEPSYIVAPTQQVPVVRPSDVGPEGLTMRWGLIPFSRRECHRSTPSSMRGSRPCRPHGHIEVRGNAAGGACRWQEASTSGIWMTPAEKPPISSNSTTRTSSPLPFAGLWDRSFKSDGTAVESVAHITMPGNDLMRKNHNTGNNPHRMPAILRRQDHETWLHGSVEEAKAVLQPYPPDHMFAFEVSTRVNSPKNNSPDLIDPVRAMQSW